METLFGLDVVVDDDLHARAVAEGQGLEDEGDLFCWLAERARETGCWPRCGCERRGLCCLDHRVVRSSTGEPALPPTLGLRAAPADKAVGQYRGEARAGTAVTSRDELVPFYSAPSPAPASQSAGIPPKPVLDPSNRQASVAIAYKRQLPAFLHAFL